MDNSLDKLTIRGFKSIREMENFELKKLNILVGANGAGKSNLISFFQLLQSLMNNNLDIYIKESGGISDLLFNGRKITQEMEFVIQFGNRGYRFKILADAQEGFFLKDEQRYYAYGHTGWWGLGNSPDGKSLLVKEVNENLSDAQYSKPVYEAIRSWKIYHFHDTSKESKMRHAEIIEDNEKLRSDASNIAPFLLRLKKENKESYEEIVKACQLVMPYFDDFVLKSQEYGQKTKVSLAWNTKGSDYPMQSYHLSDGSIRFICLATALLQPEPPATLIIDEPELGLHPQAIDILAELIESASNRTQIIIATQSPALLNNFSVEDIVVVKREEGASIFERLNPENYKVWLEEYSLGELWTKNVIQGGIVHE